MKHCISYVTKLKIGLFAHLFERQSRLLLKQVLFHLEHVVDDAVLT